MTSVVVKSYIHFSFSLSRILSATSFASCQVCNSFYSRILKAFSLRMLLNSAAVSIVLHHEHFPHECEPNVSCISFFPKKRPLSIADSIDFWSKMGYEWSFYKGFLESCFCLEYVPVIFNNFANRRQA